MVNNNISNTDRLKSGLAYAPLVGIWFYFTEKNKSAYFTKHINYGVFLFILFILLRVVLLLLWLPIGGLLVIAYLGGAIYLGMKAYNGENIDIEVIDTFYANNFKGGQNTSNVENKEETKQTDEGEAVIKTNNIVVDKIANGFTKLVKDVKKDEKDEFYEGGDEVEDVKTEEEANTQKKETKKDEDVLDF